MKEVIIEELFVIHSYLLAQVIRPWWTVLVHANYSANKLTLAFLVTLQ